MNQKTDYEDLIDRLGKASLELKETIREAHQASRDLRETIREAKKVLSGDPVNEVIAAQVGAQLATMGDNIVKHTHATYDNVLRQFDKLTKPLMDAIAEMQQHVLQMDIEIGKRQQILRDMQ